MVLGVNDLTQVLDELYKVRTKWYDIGLRLNVPAETLEKINARDNNTCLRKVLIPWLGSGKATWPDLCQALRHRTIDQGKLADALLAKYHTVRESTQTISAGSNSSRGTSAAANTNSNPTRECQSAQPDGTSKSREKPSAVAAKAGEDGTTKAKKRLSTSDSPGPSPAKKSKLASTKLPDSFARDDFVKRPQVDRLCVKCERVPCNPQRSVCCNQLYCEPCSKKYKRCSCRTFKSDLQYTSDKELYKKIQKLKIKCPNPGSGCNWTDTVFNLKHHLPACDIGGHTQGKGAGVQKKQQAEKASKAHSKATESGPSVVANRIEITVNSGVAVDKQKQLAVDSRSSNGTSLSTATGEGHDTETTGAAKPIGGEANESRITIEDVQGTSASTASCLPHNMVMKRISDYQTSTGNTWFSPTFLSHAPCSKPCEYKAIGCEERVPEGKMKEHLQGSIQHHLDLAIKRILATE